MTSTTRCAATTALAWALLQLPLLAWAQPAQDKPDAESVARGKQAFMEAGCYQCHGLVGQGGVGPKLAPKPLPVEALTAFVRYTARNMPPYPPSVLSDADLKSIHTYLASIPPSPTVDQIPELKLFR